MTTDIKTKIEKLRQEIREHDYKYYVLSQPEVSDKEYDDLLQRLKEVEERHPEFKSSDSPTVRVSGGILAGFKTVRHKQKMLSLDNTYSFDELQDWDVRVHKGLNGQPVGYVAELKIDGASANITYKGGKLVTGATRGDGETGEDITQNIKTIRAIPLVLRGDDIPELIEIRGEVYMERTDFEALNKEREEAQEALFANPRNAASGSLKLLDTQIVAKRGLNFFAHSLGEYKGADIPTQADFFKKLKEWGIRVNLQTELCRTFDEAKAYCAKWQDKRESLSYEIDGVVLKVNSLAAQKRLGFTHKSPRWAVAYKFPARQATTQVKSIKVQVGRTGVITPVAELAPVACAGVIIQHATLHNFDEIRRLNIREGDRVLIERAGDVIPKVVKVVQSRGKKPFTVPKACPACSGKIVREKEEDVALRCINPSCPAQLERGLVHFASRQAMDIEGMGEAVVEQLVKQGMVHDFADIYSLKKNDLLKLDLFKDKKAENLLAAIEKSKHRPLSRLIYGLGVKHVGEKAAYILAQKFRTLDNILNTKKEDFDAIYEVGPVIAASITDFFTQQETKNLMRRLKEAGLFLEERMAPAKITPLSGKTIVFTGELKAFSRSQAEELARGLGANTASSVSSKTDFVVAADNPGSKYTKAKKLGIKIITEEQFQEMIE